MSSGEDNRSSGSSTMSSGSQSSAASDSSPPAMGQPATSGPDTPSAGPAPGIPAAGAPNRRSPGWYAARCLEEVEAAERRLERPANADQLVAQFMDCTSTDVGLAEMYIQNNGWDLEVALQQFWEAVHPESSDDELSDLSSGDSGSWEDSEDGKESGGGRMNGALSGGGSPVRRSAKGRKKSYADENPNVDRSKAVKGRRDDGKLTITLMRDGQPWVSTYGPVVDWNNASHIHGLNRYRQQVFRRNLAPIRRAVLRYLPEENQYLVDIHRAALRASGGQGRRLSLAWDAATEDFNARFAGRVLDGSPQPRPKRSKSSLQAQSARIDEIARITGKKPRSKKQGPRDSEENSTPQPTRRDNDNGDDEDGPLPKL